MKFDVVIGNPPYQENIDGNNRSLPIYNYFTDESYKISNVSCLIMPGRFLFNAGQTPQNWNEKMLRDNHVKVTAYYKDSSDVFSGTDIKGGVAIIYRNKDKTFEPIGLFIPEPLLKQVMKKVKKINVNSLSNIHYNRSSYKLTENVYVKFPSLLERSNYSERLSIGSNIFDKLPEIFLKEIIDESRKYIGVFGRKNNERLYQWTDANFIQNHENMNKYKVFVAKSNGTGEFGEKLSEVEIGYPYTVSTQTFISFGSFNNEFEAVSLKKYLQTKFVRSMLGIFKVTPDNARKNVWEYVPLEDFTENSDINWSMAISEIDQQLYKKYGLSQKEVEFIETNVKEME